MEKIESFRYRIAARTEAAGKYDPSAPREGNEDSFCIISDAGSSDDTVLFDTVTDLPEKGVLMVVADGMGGHSAGEVASQIAIDTVREMFATGVITEKECATKDLRAKYLEQIVLSADRKICAEADSNPDRKGMGSTIVMAWIVGNELTITWCGDSRAYLYHPGKFLEMLSEDHSMVQDLVRNKQLKYEETFSHPQGNIITRCLGGGGKGNAQPESRHFTLSNGDIIMLCSDGLSGVLFDDGRLNPNTNEPYSAENIQDIMDRSRDSLKDTLTCLFDAARRCDWYDNVTAVLLEFNREGKNNLNQKGLTRHNNGNNRGDEAEKAKKIRTRILTFVLGFCLVIFGYILCLLINGLSKPNNELVEPSVPETEIEEVVEEPAVSQGSIAEPGNVSENKEENRKTKKSSEEKPKKNNPTIENSHDSVPVPVESDNEEAIENNTHSGLIKL